MIHRSDVSYYDCKLGLATLRIMLADAGSRLYSLRDIGGIIGCMLIGDNLLTTIGRGCEYGEYYGYEAMRPMCYRARDTLIDWVVYWHMPYPYYVRFHAPYAMVVGYRTKRAFHAELLQHGDEWELFLHLGGIGDIIHATLSMRVIMPRDAYRVMTVIGHDEFFWDEAIARLDDAKK